jgi:hypothetical protein
MRSDVGPADRNDGGGFVGDWSKETIAALFRALEGIDADVSPALARSVQGAINVVKQVGREFGFLTEAEARDVFGPGNDWGAQDFALRYRGQRLYPGFLFERSPSSAGSMRVRPLMKDLKKIADEYGWTGSDVVIWMASPTTWFAEEDRPVDHFEEPARILAAFEGTAEESW